MFILIYPSCIPFSGSPSSIYELAVCGRIHRYMIFYVALMPLHSVSYRDILGSLTFPCFFLFLCSSILMSVRFLFFSILFVMNLPETGFPKCNSILNRAGKKMAKFQGWLLAHAKNGMLSQNISHLQQKIRISYFVVQGLNLHVEVLGLRLEE